MRDMAPKKRETNLMIGTWVGLRYYLARKYDRATEQGRNTVDLDPNFAAAHLLRGKATYKWRGTSRASLICRKQLAFPEIARSTWLR